MTKDLTGLRRVVSDHVSGGARGRKDKHVSRACNACRRKKSKCDGTQPRCTTCEASNIDCTWTQEEDGRRPATKGQVDAMQLEIRTLKTEHERQQALIDRLTSQIQGMGVSPDWGPLQPSNGSPIAGSSTSPTQLSPTFGQNQHSRGSSLNIKIPDGSAGGSGHNRSVSEGSFLGVPGGSPASLSSSLPVSPHAQTSHFLQVPSPIAFRGGSPSPSEGYSSFGGSTTDTDDERSALSDGEDEPIMGPFASNQKRMVINDDAEVMAVQGASPLALYHSPPHTPSRSRASSIRGSFGSPPGVNGSGFANFRFPPGPGGPGGSPTGGLLSHFRSNSPQRPSAAIVADGSKIIPEPSPIHDADCPCDWARHLPASLQSSITQNEHDTVLDRYLRAGVAWGMIVVRPYFLRDMRVALSSPHSHSHTYGGMGALQGLTSPDATSPSSTPFHQQPGKLFYYSPALHCAVLADAAAFADPGTLLAHPDARAMLARTARDLAEAESLLSTGTNAFTSGASEHSAHSNSNTPTSSPLAAVAAFAILARYHLARSGGARLAYAVFGMAVRSALSLGLNMNLHAAVHSNGGGERVVNAGMIGEALDAEERNARDWLFWSLFIQDVDISLHVGQERTVPSGTNVPLPPLPVNANEQPSTSSAAVFEYAVSLMQIMADMTAEQATLSGRGPSGALDGTFARTPVLTASLLRAFAILNDRVAGRLVSSIQSRLAQWHAELPDALTLGRTSASAAPGPVLMLHCAHWWVEILLHREFYVGFPDSDRSAKFVDEASKKILRTMRTYDKLNGFNRAPLSCVPMVFAAGAAALMRADATPLSAQKRRREALEAAHDAIEQLRALADPWPCCEPYANAIEERAHILAAPLRNLPVSGHSPSQSVQMYTPSHEHRHSVPAVVVEPTDPAAAATAQMTATFGALFNNYGGPALGAGMGGASGLADSAMQDWITTSANPQGSMFGLGLGMGTGVNEPPRDFHLGMPGANSMLFNNNPDAGDGQAMYSNSAPNAFSHVLPNPSVQHTHSPQASVSSLATYTGGSPAGVPQFISASPTHQQSAFLNSSPTQVPEQLAGTSAPVYGYPHGTHHLHHHHGHPGHGGHAQHQSSGSMDMSMSSSGSSIPMPQHESSAGSLSGSMSHDGVWSSGSWSQSQ
ncbi:hypothetical protein BKA62DRAFT_410722 [Auriculariales sp. MPI-PUGE-AT-0066]|nr:hypothetical protein BKA62DRAFT_410722 [Auriculariales sp. MPI-PUGE-AT-0066]